MSDGDKIYFATRAAEEGERALATDDPSARDAHMRLQRAYLERASTGERKAVDRVE